MPPQKPSYRGPIGPGLVAPEWAWAWRGLRYSLDIRSDTPTCAVTHTGTTKNGSPTQVFTPSGPGLEFTDATSDRLTGDVTFDWGAGLFASRGVTVHVYGFRSAQDLGSFYWNGDGTGAGEYQGGILPLNSTDIRYYYRGASSNSTVDVAVPTDRSLHSMTNVWSASDETHRAYLDGVQVGSNGSITATDASFDTRIGWARSDGAYDLDGGILLVQMWDRPLSASEVRLLSVDPFGPIRPQLWSPPLAAVGATVSLYATADGTITTLVDEADASTNIYTSIDDDPASPSDSDWINNSTGTGTGFFDITDMPTGFGNADTAEIVARYRGQNFGSGTVTLYAQLYQSDETTTLSNEVQVAQVTGTGSFADTSAVTFTGLNTTAGKAVWDAARVRLRWATT